MASSISNSVANDLIVSIISSVMVDFPLAVSPAIPIAAGRAMLPDKYLANFEIIAGL